MPQSAPASSASARGFVSWGVAIRAAIRTPRIGLTRRMLVSCNAARQHADKRVSY